MSGYRSLRSFIDAADLNLLRDGVVAAGLPKPGSFFSTFECPYTLISSLASLYPESIDCLILDCPRSSAKFKAPLLSVSEDGIKPSICEESESDFRYNLRNSLLFLLVKARRLLSSKGVLLIMAPPAQGGVVRDTADSVFGHQNYLGELVYQTRSGGGSDAKHLSLDHEYVFIYAKSHANVGKFTLEKSADELARYKEVDEVSRYTWDTFIRKNARNYYPIKCPDGSVLEYDENGDKISWLWSKKTFEKKKATDIEFRKIDGKYRLFYKDRYKDIKIARSLILNSTNLGDVSSEFPGAERGRSLLNQSGSAEIKGIGEEAPEYLKPSALYAFLMSVFVANQGTVFVPLPDHGASLAALPTVLAKKKIALLANNAPQYKKLVVKRAAVLKNGEHADRKALPRVSAAKFFSESGGPEEAVLLQIIGAIHAVGSFRRVKVDSQTFHVAEGEDSVVLVQYSSKPQVLANLSTDIDQGFRAALLKTHGDVRKILYTPGFSLDESLPPPAQWQLSIKLLPFSLLE